MLADEWFANQVGIIQGGFLGVMADWAMGSATITFAKSVGRKVISANVDMKKSTFARARVGATLE